MGKFVHRRRPVEPSPSAELVRPELDKILSSEFFSRSDRLSAFLTFIVEQTLDGHGDTLKEQVIASELYGKPADFSAAADPIVRVDARRLRDKLREYYASAPNDPLVISVPKGSYTPDFAINSVAVGEAAAQPSERATLAARPRAFHGAWLAGGVLVLAGAIAWLVMRPLRQSEPPAVRLLTVTSFPGLEGSPALSPDGNFVAFSWTGPNFLALSDLWVKAVDGDALRRLTDTPNANEVYAAWSPDGQQIAFARIEGEENRGIYTISALGGVERKVADWGWRPTWLPDSHALIMSGRASTGEALFLQVLETGARRQLTTPPTGFSDGLPMVSPDGTRVGFVRRTRSQAALFVLPLAGGEPERIDEWVRSLGPPDWTPDSREIFYPRWDANGSRVFRVAAKGGPTVPVASLPTQSISVSLSGFRPNGTFRVAAVDARSDVGLRMIDVQAPQSGGQISAWTAFCDSTRYDWPARFSRDGARVAFTSDRNGPQQVFIAARDGSEVRALTAASGVSTGLASWSPDGSSLVFDAVASDNSQDLYVVSANGGPLRRLTHDDMRETNPEWSRDGRWIYYQSDASGRAEIWKIPAAGGNPVPITTQGGSEPRESPDGQGIYFLEPLDNPYKTTTLKYVGHDGGNARTVLTGIWPGAWDVGDQGIFFLTGARGIAPDQANPDTLEVYRFNDRLTRQLGQLPFPVTPRGYSPPRVLTVSPAGRWLIVSHMDNWTRDIMVADNFR